MINLKQDKEWLLNFFNKLQNDQKEKIKIDEIKRTMLSPMSGSKKERKVPISDLINK